MWSKNEQTNITVSRFEELAETHFSFAYLVLFQAELELRVLFVLF